MGARELTTRVRAALERAADLAPGAPSAVARAEEAAHLARELDDPALLATALQLLLRAHAGPEDLLTRFDLSLRLRDLADRLDDPAVRLQATLWRLDVALEQLDLPTIRRELAALEVLAEATDDSEPASGQAHFLATSRRAMFALTEGDVVGATVLADVAGRAAAAPDHAELALLHAQLARQRNDHDALARAAESFESRGATTTGTGWLAAAAVLWLDCGETEHAAALVDRIAPQLADLPRDAGWLAILAKTCEAAAGTGRRDAADTCARMLAPYAGRAVLEGEGIAFAGVVEDYLVRATGDPAQARSARLAYERLGASWWADRAHLVRSAANAALPRTLHLHPVDDPERQWCAGSAGAMVTMPPMPGLTYLQELLAHPGQDLPATDLYTSSRPVDVTGPVHPDRARVVVRRAVMSALARLDLHDSALATELRATVRLGPTCRYEPAPFRPVTWHLDRHLQVEGYTPTPQRSFGG